MQVEQKQTANASSQRAALQAATAHHREGRLAEAEVLYQQILQVDPNNSDALHMLGLIAAQLGSTDAAITLFKKAIVVKSSDATYHCNLGLALAAKGVFEEAVASYRKAISLKSNYAAYHNNLGIALLALGQHDLALASFRKAIALQSDFADAYNNMANALLVDGQLEDAAVGYRRALSLQPDHVEALGNLGNVLYKQGRLEESITYCHKALALRPNHAQTHNNLGNALQAQRRFEDAMASYQQALICNPQFSDAHSNLGRALENLGHLEAATASYRQALQLNPDHQAALNNLGNVLVAQGRFEAAAASYRAVLALNPKDAETYSNYLATAQYRAGYSQLELLNDHLAYAQCFEAPLRAAWPLNDKRVKSHPLKVGFVSGDLGEHPVGFFLESILAHIDRESIEVTLYPTIDRVDEVAQRLKQMKFSWHSLIGLSDESVVRRIRDDGIEILIDLSGHTAHGRLTIFARKPAPLQVSWLGYWATTGLQAMDYILVDRWGVLEEEAHYFVEQLWFLPDTRLCFTVPKELLTVAVLPALTNEKITFGCFNNLSKMGDDVVALWAQILREIPQSQLFLKSKQLADVSMRQLTEDRFAAHGIAADRLILEGHSSRLEYLAAYDRVDIALDPFPFAGATTSVEGLWMGVPFITRHGDRMVARQGEGILNNMGLSDWIAMDNEAYVGIAVARAANLPLLAELRSGLRTRLLESPLCDAPRFARHLENALLAMWQAYIDRPE